MWQACYHVQLYYDKQCFSSPVIRRFVKIAHKRKACRQSLTGLQYCKYTVPQDNLQPATVLYDRPATGFLHNCKPKYRHAAG